MFAEIKLTSIEVETILVDHLIRGEIQSRGDMLVYLNDRNWTFLAIHNAELDPLASDRKIGTMKKGVTVVNKAKIEALSIPSEEDAENVKATYSHRPVIFVQSNFVIRGDLHVSGDAPNEDALDEMHDFFAVTNASLFPIRPLSAAPIDKVPMLFINRHAIQAYRVHETA